jgi:hypothetical protein
MVIDGLFVAMKVGETRCLYPNLGDHENASKIIQWSQVTYQHSHYSLHVSLMLLVKIQQCCKILIR